MIFDLPVIYILKYFKIDQLPKPSHIKLVVITSRKAVIGWENIPANRTTHGILLGYKVELVGNNRRSNFSLKSDQKDFRIPNLMPSSKYTFTIRGFTQYGDGKMLQYNFSTLGLYSLHSFFKSHAAKKSILISRNNDLF